VTGRASIVRKVIGGLLGVGANHNQIPGRRVDRDYPVRTRVFAGLLGVTLPVKRPAKVVVSAASSANDEKSRDLKVVMRFDEVHVRHDSRLQLTSLDDELVRSERIIDSRTASRPIVESSGVAYSAGNYISTTKRRRTLGLVAAAAMFVAVGAVLVEVRSADNWTQGSSAATVTVAPSSAAIVTVSPSSASETNAPLPAPASSGVGAGVEQYLDDLRPSVGHFSYRDIGFISDRPYVHTVSGIVQECSASDAVEYLISKGYRALVATAGLDDESADASLKVQLEIFGDGRKLLSTTLGVGKITPIRVDITNVLRLRISWKPVKSRGFCGSQDNYLNLGEARFTQTPIR
jgi:hypothetical protein